ncbi:DUF1015 domain-containing protein [Chryseobacterium nematophagum]|uniref:DUF1015 domain-containing protein n=2 Tax=Chryseobacterium TaxID=59732 RepID=A0A6N4X871_9FLAO|nr:MULTISPECIES: DUF1015 domain-containing protein [Chryseobacterium]RNA62256.1 DUF1015 domain-containing protein [Chryseobacterium nematophagum]CAA7197211.1 hypothetical protein CHRY9293_03264 [Chryseobacterium potabilaquae]
MPVFKPFRGIRPHKDFESTFPTHPIDNFTQEEIAEKAQVENTYIHMIKPYVVSKSKDVDRNLRKIRSTFEDLLEDKKLVQDNSAYYLYEQIYPNKQIFRGLLGLASIEDFWNGKIKRHESTIPQKKEKLAHYLEKVNIQAEPVLLTYPANSKIELLMNHEEKNVPIFNHVDTKGIRHKIWRIDNRLKLQQFKEVIDQIDSFYIADGHHRIGSTALNAKHQKDKNKRHNGTELYNFVYSFIVSNQSIKIHDYNRILSDLNGLSNEEFLKELEQYFLIHEKGEAAYYPSQKFHISMYLGGKFYSLHVKHDLRSPEMSLDNLDHHLIDKYIFKDIFKIEDSDSSEKIMYVKGTSNIEGINILKEKIDSGEGQVGFGIYPVSFNDMIKISDLKLSMPPKCTFIEPKLVTALLMYDMKP